MKILLGAVLAIGLAACGGKEGDCKEMADHLVKVALKEVPDELKKQMEGQVDQMKSEFVKQCKDSDFSKKQKDCIMKAESVDGIMECAME